VPLVSEVMPDVIAALGKCSETVAFRRLTEAIAMLANKARWDSNLGEIDLCGTQNYVTLPTCVGTILGVATNGKPNYLTQATWHQFHLNGPGVQDCVSCQYAQVAGTFCTIRDPSAPIYLVAELESAADNNKLLRVFGTDAQGNEIFTPNPTTGVMEQGFLVPTIYGFPVRNGAAPLIARITRIQKEVTSGRIKLIAANEDGLTAHTLIGYYEPTETSPQYQRLTVPAHSWVRVKYKRKNPTITSQQDFIFLGSSQAIILAVKAVRFRLEDKIEMAAAYEKEAARLLSEDQAAVQPDVVMNIQVVNGDSFNQNGSSNIIYDGYGCY